MEHRLADKNYKKAENPLITGVVPSPAYASQFLPIDEDNAKNSLSGMKMDREDFMHNNMQPFLSKVTQNVERLDVGRDKVFYHKKEVPRMFPVKAGYHNVCGMKNNNDFMKSRVVDPIKKNNVFPIEQVRVGPGLNKGYTSIPSGGFQQADSRDYAAPVNIYNTRPKTNQKSRDFKVPFQGPQKAISKPTMIDNMAKNRPEKMFEQSEEGWFKTTGAYTMPSERPIQQNILPTARPETHIEYQGAAKDNTVSHNSKDDYGKSKIQVYDNSRQITEKRTVVSNITSIIPAVIAPLLDVMKSTVKEFLIDAPRENGNMQPQIPSKPTTYDPDTHIMKTTIKETTVHNTDVLNLKGQDNAYSAIQDGARTTTKETTVHDTEAMNLKGQDNAYSAIQDGARTTTKETTVHDTEAMNLKGQDNAYSAIQDGARTTTKETTVHDTEAMNLKGQDNAYSAIQDGARTTTKETTVHDDRTGNVRVVDAGYTSNNQQMKKTVKETTPVYDTVRNIGAREYRVKVYDPDMVAKGTLRQTTIKPKNEYGFLGGLMESIFGGYLNANYDAKETNKQYSIYEYNGIGESRIKEQMSHMAADNFENNLNKAYITENSDYTPGGGGKYVGIDASNINMKTNKSQVNASVSRVEKIYSRPNDSARNECSITKERNYINANRERLDPMMISSLVNNPFAIDITS